MKCDTLECLLKDNTTKGDTDENLQANYVWRKSKVGAAEASGVLNNGDLLSDGEIEGNDIQRA